MLALPLSPTILRRAALPLAVLVVVLASSGRASAGCGDHVVILKPAGERHQPEAAPEPAKTPCHGPNCSADRPSDHAPPVTSTALTTPSAKEVFTPVDLSAQPNTTSRRRPFETFSLSPIARASSIFHPPRA